MAVNKKQKIVRVMAIAIILFVGYGTWRIFFRSEAKELGVIEVSGRIESDDAAVAAKVSGRIREITVREGDQVKSGQVIAILDDEQIKTREDQARSAVEQADAKLFRAEQQVAVLQTHHLQSKLGINQSKIDAEGRVSQSQSMVAAAEADLARAQANYEQAVYDAERFTRLVKSGDISEREGRQAVSSRNANKAIVDASRKQLDAAQGALHASKAGLENPAIKTAEASGIRLQIIQAESDIHSAQAELERTKAALAEVQVDRKELNVVAPFDAVVAVRTAEPGEVITAGTPIVTLVDLNRVYLRGFVPEGDIGKIKVGQPAQVFLDSNPSQPYDAVVSRIDPEASFTPENTYFRDDRVKQVVGIKLQIKNPKGFAKPGMPADGKIILSDITGGNSKTLSNKGKE